jgi:hypothetical protein
MRTLLLAAVAAAAIAPAARAADPLACVTTVNSKGVTTSVCTPVNGVTDGPTCVSVQPSNELGAIPSAWVCIAV